MASRDADSGRRWPRGRGRTVSPRTAARSAGQCRGGRRSGSSHRAAPTRRRGSRASNGGLSPTRAGAYLACPPTFGAKQVSWIQANGDLAYVQLMDANLGDVEGYAVLDLRSGRVLDTGTGIVPERRARSICSGPRPGAVDWTGSSCHPARGTEMQRSGREVRLCGVAGWSLLVLVALAVIPAGGAAASSAPAPPGSRGSTTSWSSTRRTTASTTRRSTVGRCTAPNAL